MHRLVGHGRGLGGRRRSQTETITLNFGAVQAGVHAAEAATGAGRRRCRRPGTSPATAAAASANHPRHEARGARALRWRPRCAVCAGCTLRRAMTADETRARGRLRRGAGRAAGGGPKRRLIPSCGSSCSSCWPSWASGSGRSPSSRSPPSWTPAALPMVPDLPGRSCSARCCAARSSPGQRTPLLFGEPADGWRCCCEALQLDAQGKSRGGGARCASRRSRQAPATPGTDRRPAVRLDRRRRLAARADAGGDRQRPLLLDPVRAPRRRSRSRSRPTCATSSGCPPR